MIREYYSIHGASWAGPNMLKKKPVEQINFKGKNILIPILKVYCEPVKLKEIMLES